MSRIRSVIFIRDYLMADRAPYPSEKQDRFIVRLPDGMRDRIKAAAEANNRSMNAEIVSALESAYPAPGEIAYIRQIILMLTGFEIRQDEDHDFIDRVARRMGQELSDADGMALLAEVRAYTEERR